MRGCINFFYDRAVLLIPRQIDEKKEQRLVEFSDFFWPLADGRSVT